MGTEYAEPLLLLERLGDNFVFVLAKEDRELRLFAKTRAPSSTDFQSIKLTYDMRKPYKQSNVEFYLNSLKAVASDTATNRLYEFFASHDVMDCFLVISACVNLEHGALRNKLENRPVDNSRSRHKQRRFEDERLDVKNKTSDTRYLCHLFFSSADPELADSLHAMLPSFHTQFQRRDVTEFRVDEIMRRDVREPVMVSRLGRMLNNLGAGSVKDTLLVKHELSCLVSLPEKPQKYSFVPGELAPMSQGVHFEKREFVYPSATATATTPPPTTTTATAVVEKEKPSKRVSSSYDAGDLVQGT